jgi:hypothetical protein
MFGLNKNLSGFILVLLAAIVVCAVIFSLRVVPADVFVWDEGHHALYGTMLTSDVKAGDWDLFWSHTHRQTYWPFFHSWMLTSFFLVFGASYVSARSLSLFLFFLTVILTYFIALKTDKDKGVYVAIGASFLALTSPMLVQFAAMNMIELLGTLIFAAATLLYLKADEHGETWQGLVYYGLLGLSLGICMVTKYNFALALIPSIGAVMAIDLFNDWRAMREGRVEWPIYRTALKYLLVLIPLLLITVCWFTSYDMDRKISMVMWTRSAHVDRGLSDVLMQNLYYPKVVIDSFVLSKWLGFIVLISAFLSAIFFKNKPVRMMSISFILSMIITNAAVGWRLDRGFIMEIPWALILFSFMCVEVVRRVSSFDQSRKRLAFAALAILLLPAVVGLLNLPKMYSLPAKSGRVQDVMDFFKTSIPAGASASAFIGGPAFSPYLFMFHFRDRGAPVLTIFNANSEEFIRSEYFFGIKYFGASSEAYDDGIVPAEAIEWDKNLQRLRDQRYIELFMEKSFEGLKLSARIYKRIK